MAVESRPLEPVHLARATPHIHRLSLRLALVAMLIGGVSAIFAALVRLGFTGLQWLLTGSSAEPPIAAAHLSETRRFLTPIAGALLASAVLFARRWHARRLSRKPRPYVEYVDAVRHHHGSIPLVPNCWRTFSAAFSIASGAAVGREGSMIQFAAAAGSFITRRLQRWLFWIGPRELGFLTACGVAGGVTTAYNAPLAAIFFAAEIVLGALRVRELLLLALAALAGWLTGGLLLGWKPLFPAHAALPQHLLLYALAPLLALLFGAAGPVYQGLIRSLGAAKKLPLALVWSGILVGALSLMDSRVWGNGNVGLSAALGQAKIPSLSVLAPALLLLLVLRLSATTFCVGTGTVGGVFTPTLFAGGVLGALLAHALGVPTQATLCSMLGMSCLMAAATHAPLMAACMTVELTGDWALLPGLIVLNLIAWQLARRLSSEALYAIASQVPAKRIAKIQRPPESVSEASSNP